MRLSIIIYKDMSLQDSKRRRCIVDMLFAQSVKSLLVDSSLWQESDLSRAPSSNFSTDHWSKTISLVWLGCRLDPLDAWLSTISGTLKTVCHIVHPIDFSGMALRMRQNTGCAYVKRFHRPWSGVNITTKMRRTGGGDLPDQLYIDATKIQKYVTKKPAK